MRRTGPTYRSDLERLRREWQRCRRALRRDEAAFDALLERAHADAASYGSPTDPVALALLSMALAEETERRRVERRIDEFMR
jgi:hypothetical protein